LKYWDGSRVNDVVAHEAPGTVRHGPKALRRSATTFATTERRRQLAFCLASSTVALILALAFVARLAEIAADIGTALRALANAKIHSNAAHSRISTVS